jgi:hypothetical protein
MIARGELTHRVEVYGGAGMCFGMRPEYVRGRPPIIIGSDFGQVLHMDGIDGMRVFIRALLGFGIKPDEVRMMLKDNPAKLMWLDE